MTVIDASLLVKYVLHEEGWEKVSETLRHVSPLYSVDHVLKEVANALWKHAYLRKMMPASLAHELYSLVERLAETRVIVLEEERIYLPRALHIALQHGLTVYDSLYIAQAEKYGKLFTSDATQARVATNLGIETILIS